MFAAATVAPVVQDSELAVLVLDYLRRAGLKETARVFETEAALLLQAFAGPQTERVPLKVVMNEFLRLKQEDAHRQGYWTTVSRDFGAAACSTLQNVENLLAAVKAARVQIAPEVLAKATAALKPPRARAPAANGAAGAFSKADSKQVPRPSRKRPKPASPVPAPPTVSPPVALVHGNPIMQNIARLSSGELSGFLGLGSRSTSSLDEDMRILPPSGLPSKQASNPQLPTTETPSVANSMLGLSQLEWSSEHSSLFGSTLGSLMMAPTMSDLPAQLSLSRVPPPAQPSTASSPTAQPPPFESIASTPPTVEPSESEPAESNLPLNGAHVFSAVDVDAFLDTVPYSDEEDEDSEGS